jgi:hypothetical protein
MKLVCCLLLSTYCVLSYAQPPDTVWTRVYGSDSSDYTYSVQATYDGFIFCGHSDSWGSSQGDYDIWLIKTDEDGDTLWTKRYGESSLEFGWWIEQTSDSGYIIAGVTNSIGAGLSDMWLLKTAVDGETLWTKTYGGSGHEYAKSVKQTADGGYIISGGTDSHTGGTNQVDVYLVKTTASGDTVWTKTYGGPGIDGGLAVNFTSDGGYIIAGEANGSGIYDAYILKTDSLGDSLWAKVYGDAMYDDRAHSIEQTTDGGYILCGYTASINPGNGDDMWLLKTDANGDTLWTKTFGGSHDDIAGCVHQESDGGYTFAGTSDAYGTTYNAAVLIRTDSLGTIEWTKTVGGETSYDGAVCFQILSEGEYIVAGGHMALGGSIDAYLLRLGEAPGITDNTIKPINHYAGQTIFTGPLVLPEGKTCRVYDISGRIVDANKLAPGVYFLEIDGAITQKVIKVR